MRSKKRWIEAATAAARSQTVTLPWKRRAAEAQLRAGASLRRARPADAPA